MLIAGCGSNAAARYAFNHPQALWRLSYVFLKLPAGKGRPKGKAA